MKYGLTRVEKEMIKQWRTSQDENIALYFFNKYKDDVVKIIYSKINLKFSSIPLEKDDFFHLIWKSIKISLDTYKFNKNYSFKNFLAKNAYLNSIREAVKFLSNNHIILNNAYSYERILEEKKFFYNNKNLKTTIDSNFELARKSFIEKVLSFNQYYSNNTIKRIIYLKSLGYSIEEISKKSRQSISNVREIIDYICEIAKELYN